MEVEITCSGTCVRGKSQKTLSLEMKKPPPRRRCLEFYTIDIIRSNMIILLLNTDHSIQWQSETLNINLNNLTFMALKSILNDHEQINTIYMLINQVWGASTGNLLSKLSVLPQFTITSLRDSPPGISGDTNCLHNHQCHHHHHKHHHHFEQCHSQGI